MISSTGSAPAPWRVSAQVNLRLGLEEDLDRLRLLALGAALWLACGVADAQTADNARAFQTPRAGPGYTNGWSLMTPEERREYADKMAAMTNIYACRAFVEQHHRDMVTRAKEMNAGVPPPPRYDVCDGLPQ